MICSFQTFNIELHPLSGTTIPENNSGDLHQMMRIRNPNKDKIRMRIKINYLWNNSSMNEETELNTFPEQCYK